jgi:hypothetical protein
MKLEASYLSFQTYQELAKAEETKDITPEKNYELYGEYL